MTQTSNGKPGGHAPIVPTRTMFLRHFVPAAVALVIFLLFGIFVLGNASFGFSLWGLFQIGHAVGSFTSYKWGMGDERRIIENVYGEEWDRDAVLGRHVIEQSQKQGIGPSGTPPKVFRLPGGPFN